MIVKTFTKTSMFVNFLLIYTCVFE